MNDKVPCIKVTHPETHGPNYCCIYRAATFSAADEFYGAEEGETVTLTLMFMTEAEVDGLPEFKGW